MLGERPTNRGMRRSNSESEKEGKWRREKEI